MLKKILPKGEYCHNILMLMNGTTIVQALPVAISPIHKRIYTPENFGAFAIYSSIVQFFGSITNVRYELTIMLPKKEENALNIAAALGNNDIRSWLFLIPFSFIALGFFNILNYHNSRLKHYKDIVSAIIFKSVVLFLIILI